MFALIEYPRLDVRLLVGDQTGEHMAGETEQKLFDIAKGQDALMQSISTELGVKTSLYLVFSVFMFNAAFQIVNFARDFQSAWGQCAIQSAGIGAGLALSAAIALLIAALVRNYRMFPVAETAKWLKDTQAFFQQHPEMTPPDPELAIREILEDTVLANKRVNERKAFWITVGAWLLIATVPCIALGGLFSFLAYVANQA